MLWNDQAKTSFEILLNQITETWEVRFPFVIIEDKPWVEAMSYATNQLEWVVWTLEQDLMIFRDWSEALGKKHVFKVDVSPRDQNLKIDDDFVVQDRWSRQIIKWLSLAPAGRIKIVLIQNLERMNLSAANAFLKSFEEPLPGRLIVGTSRKMDGLLDTISSRACLIRTVSPTHDQLVEQWHTKSWQEVDVWLLSRCVALSQGDDTMMTTLLWEPGVMKLYNELEKLVFSHQYGYRIVQIIKELGGDIADARLLEALMIRASETEQHELISRLTLAQKMIAANVNKEHVWYWLWV